MGQPNRHRSLPVQGCGRKALHFMQKRREYSIWHTRARQGDWRCKNLHIFVIATQWQMRCRLVACLRDIQRPRQRKKDIAMGLKIEAELSDSVSRSEWLNYFCELSEKNEEVASRVLKFYEQQFVENNNVRKNFTIHEVVDLSDWSLRDEALRVFDLADKDCDGQLDLQELCNVRNNPEMAKTMMTTLDTDLSGTLSREEWLNYFYNLFLKKESSAAAVLKLYERQIRAPKTITLKKATTWEIIDSLQSTPLG